MAFLPNLTTRPSPKTGKRTPKNQRQIDKRSGYRVSLANINTTAKQDTSQPRRNVDARIQSDSNAKSIVKRVRLPPLPEAKKEERKSGDNEEVTDKTKPLNLPKCPSPTISKKSMFWMEPLGLWVPLKQGRRLYEKFSSRIDLLYKDPDCLVDPCPHIPRCDHSRSWSAVKMERQRFRELRQLRNEQLVQKTMERYGNMQEFWMEQLNNRAEILHGAPSHIRLQNFRKTTERFLAPLNNAERLKRLQERQRDWEEAWRLACERREKACRKKNPRHLLPRIIVTDYEFVVAYADHVDSNDQSYDVFYEESYKVVCTPVQCASPSNENFRTRLQSKRIHAIQNRKPKDEVFNPYRRLDPTVNTPGSFNPYEISALTDSYFDPCARLDPMDNIPGDYTSGNSEGGDHAGTKKCDDTKLASTSEINIMQDSLLVTSHNYSGTSLDTVVTTGTLMDISQNELAWLVEEIRQADYTAHLMSQLVPVPLGVSSGKIPDQHLTASSTLDVYHTADEGRLHNERKGTKGGAWLPRQHDVSPYLQIDLGHVVTVQQVATQGNPASAVKNERHKRWVTTFSLEFSEDGENWQEYQESGQLKVFTGNHDLDSVVLNSLENAVETRYVRFRPKEWHNGIAMRVEVFGLDPFSDTEVVEKPETTLVVELENSNGEEKSSCDEKEEVEDEVIEEKQEVEKIFREIDGTLENSEFGLTVEGRVVTPMILHSPAPSLVSPHEQKVEIEGCMESLICSQNLRLREFDDSDVESSMSKEMPDVSQETSSPDSVIRSPESEALPEEEQEIDSQPTEQGNDTGGEDDSSEPAEVSTSPCDVITTPHDTPVPSPPQSPPSQDPSPHESWAHALERARADGSIQRQLMREKMAEERRKKLAMLNTKRTNQNSEQTVLAEDLDELGSFLEKYCIIGKSDLVIFKNIFEKFDEDSDGFLWPDEVLEALENVNSKLLNDSHLSYIFRVLEQCDCQADIGIGFRLFSVIAALSQRVASLNDKMKMLISKCDFKTIDCTLERVKMLFECYVNEDTMKISRTDLWIGLAAGGLRTAEATIDEYFSEKHSFDFLDFLTYLPLFQEIHVHVIDNPLSLF